METKRLSQVSTRKTYKPADSLGPGCIPKALSSHAQKSTHQQRRHFPQHNANLNTHSILPPINTSLHTHAHKLRIMPKIHTTLASARVKDIAKGVLKTLPQEIRFDKIALWEQFTDYAQQELANAEKLGNPKPSIKALYSKFPLDEGRILKDQSFGPKAPGICTGHAIYVQQKLAEKGLESSIIGKKRPGLPYDDHTLLVVHGNQQGKSYQVIIDPLQSPEIFEPTNDEQDYGTPISGFQRKAILGEGIHIRDYNPKTKTESPSQICTHLPDLNYSERVSKPHMQNLDKIPWTAHNDENTQEATIVADLLNKKINIKLTQSNQKETITLEDINTILKNPETVRSPLEPFIYELPRKFDVEPLKFWKRLQKVLETESIHGFSKKLREKKLPLQNPTVWKNIMDSMIESYKSGKLNGTPIQETQGCSKIDTIYDEKRKKVNYNLSAIKAKLAERKKAYAAEVAKLTPITDPNHKEDPMTFEVIGAGLAGLCLAVRLKTKYPDATITIHEKRSKKLSATRFQTLSLRYGRPDHECETVFKDTGLLGSSEEPGLFQQAGGWIEPSRGPGDDDRIRAPLLVFQQTLTKYLHEKGVTINYNSNINAHTTPTGRDTTIRFVSTGLAAKTDPTPDGAPFSLEYPAEIMHSWEFSAEDTPTKLERTHHYVDNRVVIPTAGGNKTALLKPFFKGLLTMANKGFINFPGDITPEDLPKFLADKQSKEYVKIKVTSQYVESADWVKAGHVTEVSQDHQLWYSFDIVPSMGTNPFYLGDDGRTIAIGDTVNARHPLLGNGSLGIFRNILSSTDYIDNLQILEGCKGHTEHVQKLAQEITTLEHQLHNMPELLKSFRLYLDYIKSFPGTQGKLAP